MDLSVLENKSLVGMLEFETQIFLDVLHKDGLVVAAKGLCLDVVLVNILKVYCDPGNLVIVLNCSEIEEKYFIDKLKDDNVHSTTYSTSVAEREDVYLSGGIHFVTTRILVVDMLKNRIPIEKITGFIVLRAHTVLESCQEAFVLRLFRQRNKTGFIKAFSNSVQSFTIGFGHVERVMATLFIKELYIWPRFHSEVVRSLKQFEPKIVELNVPISTKMSNIQTCILDLMNLVVLEMKRANKNLEMQEISVENCLTKTFHKILQNQLDCIWHQLSAKTKQLLSDLKTLRHLIITLLYSDPVTFYSVLLGYRSLEYAQSCTWILLPPADHLFTSASALVFTGDKELNPDFCPKWNVLSEILKVDIPAEMKNSNTTNNNVLILCQDTRTCFQLNQYLAYGPHHYLFLMALKHDVKFKSISKKFEKCQNLEERFSQSDKKPKKQDSSKYPKRSKVDASKPNKEQNLDQDTSQGDENGQDDLENMKHSYVLTMSQTMSESLDESELEVDAGGDFIFEPFAEMENMDLTQLSHSKANSKPTIFIQTYKSDNLLSLQKTFEDVEPNYIIIYQSNVSAIRQIELYEARRKKDRPLKVYFLIHSETVEEQSYLTALRKEKEAFEFLIETKSRMVAPADKIEEEDDWPQTDNISTRKGGKIDNEKPAKQLIIVDMREFRSELPALIHKRGMDIEPVTITVGDYILTPDICVERKSLSDLIGSLNSGRLYQQCTQMSRYYTKPMLLIEFDQNRPFSWQSGYMVSNGVGNIDIQQKLLLLTLHFPKLKIVWSPSPYASAQLFEELKGGKEQPDTQYAASIGSEENLNIIETKYNSGIYDLIQKLPGITSKNIDGFLRQTKNLDFVITKTEGELKEILGNAVDARALYSIIHEEHSPKIHENINSKGRGLHKYKGLK